MSKFMDYLNKVDSLIIENSRNTYDNEDDVNDEECCADYGDEYDFEKTEKEVVRKINKPAVPIPKKVTKRNSSVKLVEDRLRLKLDGIGLNSRVVNEVISYVLYNVNAIDEIRTHHTESVQHTQHKKQQPPATIVGYADSILEGMTDHTPMTTMGSGNFNESINNNISDVADHASSLL